ncbi:MAG: cytochrome C, partial [Thermoanaerobaculia bacterium]
MIKLFKGSGLYRNAISYFGIIVIFISAGLILATLLWSFSLKAPSPYLGIFAFLIFPAFLFFGILL